MNGIIYLSAEAEILNIFKNRLRCHFIRLNVSRNLLPILLCFLKAPRRSTNKIQVTHCMFTLCSELDHDMTLARPQHIKGVNGYN